MVNQFIGWELILYLWPVVLIVILPRYVKQLNSLQDKINVNLPMLLLPTWGLWIHLFSLLIYSYTLIFWVSLWTFVVLGFHLGQYTRRVKRFALLRYMSVASRLVFMIWTVFLASLLLLRIYTYFY